MKILFTFILLSLSISSFAQDTISYKTHRSVWSVIPRFGVGDKQTRENFTTYGGIGLRREFALFKLLSLNATANYSSVYGRFGNANLNVVALGGGLTLYPFYVIDKINKLIYGKRFKPNRKVEDEFYFDITAEFSLNNTKYGSAGDLSGPRAEFNLGRYKLNKMLFLSPKFGEHFFIYPTPKPVQLKSDQSSFFYIGAAIGINPKPKNR